MNHAVRPLKLPIALIFFRIRLQRSKITSGDYEPNEEECEWSSDDDEKEEEKKIISEMNKVKIKEEEDSKENE